MLGTIKGGNSIIDKKRYQEDPEFNVEDEGQINYKPKKKVENQFDLSEDRQFQGRTKGHYEETKKYPFIFVINSSRIMNQTLSDSYNLTASTQKTPEDSIVQQPVLQSQYSFGGNINSSTHNNPYKRK